MKDTIRSFEGFRVNRLKDVETGEEYGIVFEGNQCFWLLEIRDMKDYLDEVVRGGNRGARTCDVFTTTKGKQFVTWTDDETNMDYLTEIAS